ncbi:MAG: hypothetical protein IPP40_11855 [bacterium]|nr:hypothetical protein [bacterium]
MSVSRAEIPLELIAEFQLPEGATAWDVQHWMDDSTFGWVAVVGDTIWYSAYFDSSPNWAVVPDSMIVAQISYNDCVEYEDYTIHPPEKVRIANVEGEPPGTTVVLLSRIHCMSPFGDYNYEHSVTYGFSLPRSEMITTSVDVQTFAGDICYHGGETQTTYDQFDFWPRPPETSQWIIASGTTETWCDPTGTDGDSRYSSGFLFGLATGSAIHLGMHPVIPDWTGLEFNCVGLRHRDWVYYSEGQPWEMSFAAHSQFHDIVAGDTMFAYALCLEDTVYSGWDMFDIMQNSHCLDEMTTVARNASGDPFAMFSGPFLQGACINTHTGDILWQVNDAATQFAADVVGTLADEFLVWRSWQFDVYDLARGQIVGRTSECAGQPVQIIERRERAPELLTFENATRIVRAYRFVPQWLDLTIAQASIGGQIILRWQPISSASGYDVCRNVDYSDDLCSGGDTFFTTDTMMVLMPLPGASKEFYRVVPLFE